MSEHSVLLPAGARRAAMWWRAVTAFAVTALSIVVTAPTASADQTIGNYTVAWGSDGDSVPSSLAGKTVTAIAAGGSFSLALTGDGQVTAWGLNSSGQTSVPASLAGKTVTAIAAGQGHSLALTGDGQVTAWGWNGIAQISVPASLTGKTVTAIAAGGDHSLALTSDGQVTDWSTDGANGVSTYQAPASLTGKTVTAIAAGQGHSLALTSDGQVTAWGLNSSGQTSVPASLAGKTVTAIAGGGFHSLAIVRAAAPSITGQPGNVTVVSGQAASFTAVASGDPAPSVRWQKAVPGSGTFTDIAGATSSTYTTGTLGTADSGARYRAVFTNAAGTATSDPATVSVRTAPSVTGQPGNATVVSGQAASFTAAASGDPAPSVRWQKAVPGSGTFTDIAGATSSTYTTGTLGTADSGARYRAVFSNPAGAATSNPAVVTVNPAAPAVTGQPDSVNIPSGQPVSFTAAASGDPAPTVQWQKAPVGSGTFTNITGATSTTYTTGTLGTADSGTRYRAVFSNPAGAATSNPADVTVVTLVVLQPPNAALGQPYSYTVPVTGTSTPTVTLTGGALPAGLTLNSSGTISGTPTEIGGRNFYVSSNGSPAAAVGTINVQPAATITGPAPDGDTSTNYDWTPTTTGGATVTLAGGALPDGVTLNAGGLSGMPTKTGPFTFTLQAANGYGAPATLTSTITIRQVPTIAGTPTSGTAGLPYTYAFTTTGTPAPTVTLTAGTLPDGLTLSPSGTISGTPTKTGTLNFTVTAGNGASRSASRQVSIAISGSPVLTGTPPVGTIGVAYSYPFTVAGSPAPTVTTSMGTLPPGLTLSTGGVLSGTPTQAGTYTFIALASNGLGYDAAQPVTMTVGAAPTISGNAPTGTVGVAYNHTYPTTGTGATVTGIGLPAGLSLSNTGALSGTPTKAGVSTITVTVSNQFGMATKTQTLTVNPATTGQATIAAAPASVQPGAWESDTDIRVLGEKSNQTLTAALTVGGTTIPAGTRVNSYYLHADSVGAVNTAKLYTGTVDFGGAQVLAVAISTNDLQATAGQFGLAGTTYPTSADQGLEYDDTTTTTNNKITINLNVYNSSDAIRIITLAP